MPIDLGPDEDAAAGAGCAGLCVWAAAGSVIASSNRDLPAYVRYGAAKNGEERQGHASLRAMGAGEEEFLFEDEALDTPAFIRRNAD